ncbi:MAG TPA: cytochrome c [Sphingobium sp.]|nr:cytochrome c [Sphingobium sp.]
MTRIHAHPSLGWLAMGVILVLPACNRSPESSGSKANDKGKVTYLDKASIPKDPAEMVLQQTCMSCHATGVGPVITGRNLPPEAVKSFVRNGNRAMPAFTEAMIDNDTLDRVAQLVATSKASPAQTTQ